MDDLYNDNEINNSLADKATAFEDLLAGLSLSDDAEDTATASETEGTRLSGEVEVANDGPRIAEGMHENISDVRTPGSSHISPASQIYQTIRSDMDAAFHWLGKSKVQLQEFIDEAKRDVRHPLVHMCVNLESIITLLQERGDKVLDPASSTFGYVEVTLAKLLEYLSSLEELDESGWLDDNVVGRAEQIEKCLRVLKNEHMVVDGKKNIETVAKEDRVVIEDSPSEEDSEDEEVETRPRVILVPKGRLGRHAAV